METEKKQQWEGDGSVKDQNLQTVMEVIGVDSATGENAEDFTKYGYTAHQIAEVNALKETLDKSIGTIQLMEYGMKFGFADGEDKVTSEKYAEELLKTQNLLRRWVVGDQHVFEDGKFTRELHDAIQDYKTKSKFWLEPDSNGNIISPYNAQEEWAKSMYDQRETKGLLQDQSY